jgi:hypothetical protein
MYINETTLCCGHVTFWGRPSASLFSTAETMAIGSSKTLVTGYWTTHHIPDDSKVHRTLQLMKLIKYSCSITKNGGAKISWTSRGRTVLNSHIFGSDFSDWGQYSVAHETVFFLTS